MPETHDSYVEKGFVKKSLHKLIGSLRQKNSLRPDWLIDDQKSLSIFITFSKADQLFYDISIDDLKNFLVFDRSFVLFVLGKNEKVLVVPFLEILKNILELNLARDGAVKLHVSQSAGRIYFKETPDFNMGKYLNKYAILLG